MIFKKILQRRTHTNESSVELPLRRRRYSCLFFATTMIWGVPFSPKNIMKKIELRPTCACNISAKLVRSVATSG